MDDFKLLIVTRSEPDAPSGSPQILRGLIQVLGGENVRYICQRKHNQRQAVQFDELSPEHVARIESHKRFWPFKRGDRIRQKLEWLNIVSTQKAASGYLKTFKADGILCLTFGWPWVVAAHKIAKAHDLPLVYWVHDPLVERAGDRNPALAFARKNLESYLYRQHRLAVLSTSLIETYESKYNFSPKILRHFVHEKRMPLQTRDPARPPILGFSGLIYGNNRDLICHLAKVHQTIENLEIRFFTNTPIEEILSMGFVKDRCSVRFMDNRGALLKAIAQCDLCYMPLSFHGTEELPREALRLALPTKLIDYLICGPRIIIHAPVDFDVTKFAIKHRCADVCTENNSKALAATIHNALINPRTPEEDAARKKTLEEFSPELNFDRLKQLFSN